MTRTWRRCSACCEAGAPRLLPYFTAGWPTPEDFQRAVRAAGRAGCTAFEVGIPFTDPVDDGPVIQRTSQQALEAGVTVDSALEATARAVRESRLPAIAMTYAKPVWRRGPERFCRELAAAGGEGLIVPDLPVEEGEELEEAAAGAGLNLVYLCARTTPPPRRLLARRTRGFLYLISVTGVTGPREQLPARLEELIREVRGVSRVPVGVALGVSSPETAAAPARHAHGVIVGRALLRRMEGREVRSLGHDLEGRTVKVLIIGGTRFIGPHVARCLMELGCETTLFHRGRTETHLPRGVRHILGDRQRLPDFKEVLRRLNPRVILDMIPFSERDARTVMSMFRGIACRVVALSSQDVYRAYGRLLGIEPGPPEPLPLSEDAPLRRCLHPYRGIKEGGWTITTRCWWSG